MAGPVYPCPECGTPTSPAHSMCSHMADWVKEAKQRRGNSKRWTFVIVGTTDTMTEERATKLGYTLHKNSRGPDVFLGEACLEVKTTLGP